MDHFSMHRLERTWMHYGVDAPSLVGFLFGALSVIISGPCIRKIILYLVDKTLGRLPPEPPNQTDDQRKEEKELIHSIFDWPGAELIGILERFLYVYSVLEVPAWPLMAGWLAMKAFFIRLAEPENAQFPPSRRQAIYHLYLYGNVISVLAGLICGHFARLVCAVIWKVF
jgi:hypothetical protein